jgi:C-terminal processing protease CtpA/Prc
MKKSLLPVVCSMVLLLLAANAFSQQTTNPQSDKVVIIHKMTNDDGTTIVKKKRIDKGQDVETYLDAMELKGEGKNLELMIITDEEKQVNNDDPETIIYIRKAKSSDEVKSCDKMVKDFETLHITMPGELEQELFMHNIDRSRLALVDGEKKAFLGVYSESSEQGVLIEDIVSGSAAEAAGLKSGDIMTSLDGSFIKTSDELRNELVKYQPGNEVVITYLRNGQPAEVTVKLTEKKQERLHSYTFTYNYTSPKVERDPCKVFIGVYVGSFGNDEGVGVSGIIPGWPAEAAGLKAGDRIIAIDGIPVNSFAELTTERNKHKPGEYFLITYLRDGMPEEVRARFKECPTQQPATEPMKEEQAEYAQELPQPLELNDNSLELKELTAYPNPTFGGLNVQFKGEAVPTSVRITDVNGKVLHQETLNRFDGFYNKNLDISHGTPGTVMLSIQQGEKVVTKPVILLNRA